ncbi:MAG: hypothetical protein ACLQFR_25250 [Streptosporangiaceae bacterium]
MREDPTPAWRLRPSTRLIVARFAEVVCPPGLISGEHITAELTDELLAEFESLLAVVPASVRRLVQAAFVVFDQGARCYPPARGRRFTRLGNAGAEAYFRAVLALRRGGTATALQRVKALVVMCYYELPEVKDQLGYRPQAYIAAVSRRRLASYGAQIRAGEAALLAPDPADPGPGGPPGQGQERQ